jgi:4-hydroxy-tetrahydrodipicolinate synthase
MAAAAPVVSTDLRLIPSLTPHSYRASNSRRACRFRSDDSENTRRTRHAQRAGTDAVMMLPVSYWTLSEGETLKFFLSIDDAIGIPMMMYKNPATSGVDMSLELLAQIPETIDNVTMVNESDGDLSQMKRIGALSRGRLPF